MKIFQYDEALDQWEPSLDIPGPMRVEQAEVKYEEGLNGQIWQLECNRLEWEERRDKLNIATLSFRCHNTLSTFHNIKAELQEKTSDKNIAIFNNLNLFPVNSKQSGPPRCRGLIRGIATPALLCHKEPARRIQSPLLELHRIFLLDREVGG